MTNLLIAPGIPLRTGAAAGWFRVEGQGQATIPDPVPDPAAGNRFIDLATPAARWNGTDLQGYVGAPSAWGGAATGLLDRAGTRHVLASAAVAQPRTLGALGALDLSADNAKAYVDGLDLRGNVAWALALIVSRGEHRYPDSLSIASAFEPLTYGSVPLVRALDPAGAVYLLPTGANLQMRASMARSVTFGLILENLPGSGLRCWMVDSKTGAVTPTAFAGNPIINQDRLWILCNGADNTGAQGFLHEMVYLNRTPTPADMNTMINGVRFHAKLGERPEYGLILTGDTGAFALSHHWWAAAQAVRSLMGGQHINRLRWPDPGNAGFYFDDAMGSLRQDYFTQDYTVRETTPLYSTNPATPSWLTYDAGQPTTNWAVSLYGQEVLNFIANVMDPQDRAAASALCYFGTDTDTVDKTNAVMHGGAMRRWIGLLRTAMGRTAASLPMFLWAPIPYQGQVDAAWDAVATATQALLSDPDMNCHLALANTADAEALGGDSTRISAATELRWAIRAGYGIARVRTNLALTDSYSSQAVPGLGPVIASAAVVDATHTDLTVTHEVGTADLQVLGAAATGSGFTMTHNSGAALAVSACVKQSNTVLRLTHASATGTRTVSYCRRGVRVALGDMVVDRWSTRGWPSGMDLAAEGLMPDAAWKPDIPLRATLLPVIVA